jgi:uncharacterized lipoprotein YehR (DUF1307 family)
MKKMLASKIVLPAMALVSLVSLTGCDSEAWATVSQYIGADTLSGLFTQISDFFTGLFAA